MEFRKFRGIMQRHITQMLQGQRWLFVAGVDKDDLWNLYLDSFPPGTNEVFRERREYDCSCCRQFINQLGNAIAINADNQVVTIWDFDPGDNQFRPVVKALSEFVRSMPVQDAFVTKQGAFGTDKSLEQLDNGQVHTWRHFRLDDLPRNLVTRSHKSEPELRGEMRASKEVFQRSLEEIGQEAIQTVLDLIDEKALYRGDEWRAVLTQFLELHQEYHGLPHVYQDNYCWRKSAELGGAISRIKNHSIGTLLVDLTNGVDVESAVRKFEAIVAPSNYQRPKAIFTKRMVEQAQKTVERLGLLESLPRRHARLDDITVNNVIWSNRDAARHMQGGDLTGVFAALVQEVVINLRQFEHVTGVGIEQFISDVLPGATSVEVLVENKHQSNLVSLIAPQNRGAPALLKWSNNFGWAYNGNVADSMKARVKAAGGDVTGVLRFSIQWNEQNDNPNDYDAHCVEPGGNRIYYPNKAQRHRSSGMLDVDIINPRGVAVENITWSDLRKMPQGQYRLMVHNYSHRGGRSGFAAEVECDGQIHEYEYRQDFEQGELVQVATVELGQGGFKVVDSLPSSTSTREIWSLKTNQFYPVSAVCYSPNYWDGQQGIGNRHFFFMLAGCINPDRPNGFFNEYLKPDLREHRKVFEALGSKMRVEQSDNQLSGLGFSSTQRNALIVRVDGKPVKVIF